MRIALVMSLVQTAAVESVINRIRHLDDIVEVGPPHDRKHGTENLFTRDPHVLFDVREHGWLDPVAFFESGPGGPLATGYQPGSIGGGALDIMSYLARAGRPN